MAASRTQEVTGGGCIVIARKGLHSLNARRDYAVKQLIPFPKVVAWMCQYRDPTGFLDDPCRIGKGREINLDVAGLSLGVVIPVKVHVGIIAPRPPWTIGG